MRPPRLENVWTKNPTYFITTCVEQRMPVLASDEIRDILVGEWSTAFDRYSWAIGGYVIMPDHIHFFCSSLEQTTQLSTYVGKWKEWTCKSIRKQTSFANFQWQKGFFDYLLRNDESRTEKWEYIRNNPVRASLVNDPTDWPYQGSIDFQ